MKPQNYLILIIIMSLSFTGCRFSSVAIASLRSTSDFLILNSNECIHYEIGSEDLSIEMASFYMKSIADIEDLFQQTFQYYPDVYICSSKESFAKFTGVPSNYKGAAIKDHLFISEKRVRELPEDLRRALLTHELTHLFLTQHLGLYKSTANVPAWFNEGIAEFVSGGAAMENVSKLEARKSLLDGNSFYPDNKGSFFFPKYSTAYGLTPHMFYRQSSMFISYLYEDNQTLFNIFLQELLKGKKFKDSYNSIYKHDIDKSWKAFLQKQNE